jgi:hypothetical protein
MTINPFKNILWKEQTHPGVIAPPFHPQADHPTSRRAIGDEVRGEGGGAGALSRKFATVHLEECVVTWMAGGWLAVVHQTVELDISTYGHVL